MILLQRDGGSSDLYFRTVIKSNERFLVMGKYISGVYYRDITRYRFENNCNDFYLEISI